MGGRGMSKDNDVNLGEDVLVSLGWGLIFRGVCTPSSWSPEKVGEIATRMDPPGTSANKWVVSDPAERDGPFNGTSHLPCPDDCNRTHWLLNC